MNQTIAHVARVAQKPVKKIIGLMSGTSCDGLDIALCNINGTGGQTHIELLEFKTVAYPDDVTAELKKILSKEQVSLQDVCMQHTWLGNYHGELILQALQQWNVSPAEIDCIASHGQTIYHAPMAHHRQKRMPNSTLQIGDADHIARKTGLLTLSDFRQKHTAAGGEGAPMVALTDELLYRHSSANRLLLNIGGIANFSYLPAQGEPITTDVGPGNTLIDQAMQAYFSRPYDADGQTAAEANVHANLLKHMLDDPFFARPLPRTTGPEYFNMEWINRHQQKTKSQAASPRQIVATVTWLTAQTIANVIEKVCGENPVEIYLSGGGMHNTQLVRWIEKLTEQKPLSFQEIGFNPDAKEAVCFAVLANECLSGNGFSITPQKRAARKVNFGKISLPV